MHFFDFDTNSVSRIIKGNWQLAGGHGDIDRKVAIADLFAYAKHGVNTFDVGDIYTGVEEIVGEFLQAYRKKYGAKQANKLRIHTKFVPDLDALEDLTKQEVRMVIERSLKRLGLKRLHLVQFHWWDYAKGDYLQIARHLKDLKDEGLIEAIGLTNFDSKHTQELLNAGIPIKSNQVQFSLIDPRPLNGMLELARNHNIAIFCYGVLAGGLLAQSRPGEEPTNRSHIKYQLIIDEVGAEYYKTVLSKISDIATIHQTTPANVAVAYILQTPGVSGVILGPRNSKHLTEMNDLDNLKLGESEYDELATIHTQLLLAHKDDIYSYERYTSGPHGKIMKYNNDGILENRKKRG